MTLSIIDFLEAQLEKDAATARAACWDGHDDSLAAQWDCGEEKDGRYWWVGDQWDDGVVKTTGDASAPAGQAAHIARHDPARVLREVAAKRALLADFADELRDAERHEDVDMIEAYTRLLGVLAAVYSDHPDFDPNWSTT